MNLIYLNQHYIIIRKENLEKLKKIWGNSLKRSFFLKRKIFSEGERVMKELDVFIYCRVMDEKGKRFT